MTLSEALVHLPSVLKLKVNEPGDIAVFVQCYDDNHQSVFSTGSFFEKELNGRHLECGYHLFECVIPGNLLNDGIYVLDANLVKNRQAIIFSEKSVISFRVHDDFNIPDGWNWRPVGVIRPETQLAPLRSEALNIFLPSLRRHCLVQLYPTVGSSEERGGRRGFVLANSANVISKRKASNVMQVAQIVMELGGGYRIVVLNLDYNPGADGIRFGTRCASGINLISPFLQWAIGSRQIASGQQVVSSSHWNGKAAWTLDLLSCCRSTTTVARILAISKRLRAGPRFSSIPTMTMPPYPTGDLVWCTRKPDIFGIAAGSMCIDGFRPASFGPAVSARMSARMPKSESGTGLRGVVEARFSRD